ncbi:hypothetical protein [Lysobacter gummosus]|uniref:hypothetical protein n=1 Tax=Lysobacter gummosus TaxID=262324 RepID=UPI00363D6E42
MNCHPNPILRDRARASSCGFAGAAIVYGTESIRRGLVETANETAKVQGSRAGG